MWLDTQFQNAVESLTIGTVQRGTDNYQALMRLPDKPAWRDLTDTMLGGELNMDSALDELEIASEEEDYERYDPGQCLPVSLAEVETVKSMRFEPELDMEGPNGLYTHTDDSTTTRLLPEYSHLFAHSASSSFFAYIPVYFWKQVVLETNRYAAAKEVRITKQFTMDELMTFLGIMVYMTLNDKGEYSNYWGSQTEDAIFGGASTSLDTVMTLRRFKLVRRGLSFRAEPGTSVERDAAARIRPLLNLLKSTGGRYVEAGRDLALDETSNACRSRHGRHLIVYNPHKPGGKYHFRMYVVCCSTTWIALNYRVHCNNGDIADRLQDVVSQEEMQQLREELDEVQQVRKHVLEVVQPSFFSRRIINMDNYYTSVQLLMDLRLKGLYGRGTVRGGSKHYQKHTTLQKDESVRGDYQQSVSVDHNVLAASWCDGSIVAMVTNADPSTTTTVTRRIEASSRPFPAPTCILKYNQHMQGVDRLDQIRARFSIADGHSYKRWHKKLALGLIDIARTNAYLSRRISIDTSRDRDPHRTFLTELVSELISARWKEAPSDGRMAFGSSFASETVATPTVTPPSSGYVAASAPRTQNQCDVRSSKQLFKGKSRRKRECVVCRYEGRYPTEVTDHCLTHSACLCRVAHGNTNTPFTCPQGTWTCWDKYHRFYLPNGLFTNKGNIRRSSALAKLKALHQSNPNQASRRPPTGIACLQTPVQQSESSQQNPPSQPSSSSQQGTPSQQTPVIQQSRVARQIFE